jgi:hypothetical protein
LRQVYVAALRLQDLLTLLKPDSWHLDDAARKEYDQKLDKVGSDLKAVEDAQNQFANQPQSLQLGNQTSSAVTSLLASAGALLDSISQYVSPADQVAYAQAVEQLSKQQQPLASYVAHLGPPAPPAGSQPATAAPAAGAPSPPPAATPAGSAANPAAASGSAPSSGESGQIGADQPRSILRQIYLAAFRLQDLLTLLKPDLWHLDDAARKEYDQQLDKVRSDLKAVEDAQNQYANQPQNGELGNQTNSAVSTLLASAGDLLNPTSQHLTSAELSPYMQAVEQLSKQQQSLTTYLAYVTQESQRQVAAANAAAKAQGLETVQVNASSTPPPATSVLQPEPGYMNADQAKKLSYQIYSAAYRLEDLLKTVHPEQWKVPQAIRDAYDADLDKLRTDLHALDQARTDFIQKPDSTLLVYLTYMNVTPVVADLDAVARNLAQFETPQLGADVRQPGDSLLEAQRSLRPYLDLLIRTQNQVTRVYESSLAKCQNTLNYAMRSQTPVVQLQPSAFPVRREPASSTPNGAAKYVEIPRKIKGASTHPGGAASNHTVTRSPRSTHQHSNSHH